VRRSIECSDPIKEIAMHAHHARPAAPHKILLPLWVSGLYREASADFKVQLIESLMRPMGALGLVAVAGGAFAALRQRHGWQRLQVTLEDTAGVTADHIYQLASYLQEAAPEALSQLVQLMAAHPASLSTASGLLLMHALRRQHPQRQHAAG
jgi:hypothetical protein